jgi:hypothetical protein
MQKPVYMAEFRKKLQSIILDFITFNNLYHQFSAWWHIV